MPWLWKKIVGGYMEYNNLGIEIKFEKETKNTILKYNDQEISIDVDQMIGCIVIFRDIIEKIK